MDEARAQELITEHFGNAGVDEVKVQSIYTEDAVLEFPQGRERIRGKANIHAFRTVYPAKVTVKIWRTTFAGDTWDPRRAHQLRRQRAEGYDQHLEDGR